MRLKSYFSETVEAAMELARKELGEEALLVNARPATPETRYLGTYEVVFGLTPVSVQAETPAAPQDSVRGELADLRRQLERLTHSLPAPSPAVAAPAASPPDAALLQEELDPEWARLLAGGTSLAELISADPTLGRPGQRPAIAALVGPPGAGKTTTLVKLAARHGLALGRAVQILTTDVYRIAAADQLRTLAAILGIACEVCETPAALAGQLEGFRGRHLILIDTPGFALREMEEAAEWAAFFSSREDIDTHLVLPAPVRSADLRRIADAYAAFHPGKLLFTRLDETSRFGALANEAARMGLPLSFFCNGQQIPDDLEEASAARVSALLGLSASPAQRMGAAA